MQMGFIVSLIFSLIIVGFALMNSDMVIIRTFWGNFQLSESFVIILSAAAGALIAIFLGLFGSLKSKLKIREINNLQKTGDKQIAELNKKLATAEEKIRDLSKDLAIANQKIHDLDAQAKSQPE